MARLKLTKRTLDALRPQDARRYLFDAELAGFGVVVQPRTTSATFFCQYRAGTGRTAPKRRITIGRYGPLTVDQARQIAKQHLAAVAQGADPAAERAESRVAATVATLGLDYLDDVRTRRKATTAREYVRLWEKHISPTLGTKRVTDITPADITRLHRSLHKTPYIANRVVALAGAFFSFAEGNGARPEHTNPTTKIEPYEEHGRERFLAPAEMAALGAALVLAETVGLPPAPTRQRVRKTGPTAKHTPKIANAPRCANPYAIAAIRFLLLTGWREQEALTLRWADVDLARGRVTLPATKTGKSHRTIGAPAALLLAELPRVKGSSYVFPGDGPRAKPGQKRAPFGTFPLADISRPWTAVRLAAGLGDVRLHDLRHSFASTIASGGGSLLLIGKLLGHKDTKSTAKYAHLLDDPITATADAAAGHISAMMRGPVATDDSKAARHA